MQGPLIANDAIKKRGCKQDIIGVGGPGYVKIVFALLTEVIVVYVQFSIV